MAKFYNPIDSFAMAEEEYANTKPVAVRSNKIEDDTQPHSLYRWLLGWDVRPISCRTRKHERTVKISKNHYALVDVETVFLGWYLDQKYTKQEFLHICSKMAPINWYRNRKGEEFMTVRNVSGANGVMASISRNDFINRHAPRGMYLSSYEGKQFFHKQYLPKRTYITQVTKEKFKLMSHNSQYLSTMLEQAKGKGDYKLVYKHVNNVYTLVTEPHKVPKKVVDTETKAKHKVTIRGFRDTACAIAMMLKESRGDTDNELDEGVDKYLADMMGKPQEKNYSHQTQFADMLKNPNGWVFRSIVRTKKDKTRLRSAVLKMMNPEHKFNYGLVCAFAQYNRQFWQEKSILARYNAWVNQVCSFRKIIKVDHT